MRSLQHIEIGVDDDACVQDLATGPQLPIHSTCIGCHAITAVKGKHQHHSSNAEGPQNFSPKQEGVEPFIPEANAVEVRASLKYMTLILSVKDAKEHHREGSKAHIVELVQPLVIEGLATESIDKAKQE